MSFAHAHEFNSAVFARYTTQRKISVRPNLTRGKQIKSDRFTYTHVGTYYNISYYYTDATMNNLSVAEAQIVFYSR